MNRKGKNTSLELEAKTALLLSNLAQAWGVSEEETIRRALKQAGAKTESPSQEDRWEAFEKLRNSLSLTPAKASEWQNSIREARR